MKKALSLIMVVAILLSFSACFGGNKGVIGETYTSKSRGVEFTLNAVEFADAIDGWSGANDDFWKPLDENNCNIGGRYATLDAYKLAHGLVPSSEDDVIVFISYTAKNISENDKIIDDIGVLDYDDGYTYSEGNLAYRSKDTMWKEIPGGLVLEKLKGDQYEFRAYMIVPKEIAESDKSLTYTLFGYKFELR